jgi:hypothetical protein
MVQPRSTYFVTVALLIATLAYLIATQAFQVSALQWASGPLPQPSSQARLDAPAPSLAHHHRRKPAPMAFSTGPAKDRVHIGAKPPFQRTLSIV